MYLQQYEVSMTILDYFYPRLKNYIDFDFTDQLSPPRLKKRWKLLCYLCF